MTQSVIEGKNQTTNMSVCELLLKYNILYDHQFGFIPGKNTTHATLSLVDYLIDSFEDNKLTCGIFLDISKAFDAIDHNILWKLHCIYKHEKDIYIA